MARGSWPAVAAAILSACSNSGSGGTVCTDIFGYITATAIDSTGAPVTDLAIRDSVWRTHQAFDITEVALGILTPGTYTIFSDSDLDDVRESGDSVQVMGNSIGAGPGTTPEFSAVYVFGSDGCHVKKISGADTVVAR